MRKDVKLGLAVGGVLLAVLVVYVLVVPGNNANKQGADVTIDGGSEAYASGDAAGSADGSGASGTSSRAESGGGPAASKDATGAAQDKTASAGGASSGNAAGGATADRASGATAGADKPSGETAGGGWNWDALVAGTEKVPALGASTDVQVARGAGNANALNVAAARAGDTTGAGASGASGAIGAAGDSSMGAQTTSGDAGVAGAGQQPSTPRQNVLVGGADSAASATGGSGTAPGATASAAGGKHVVKSGDTYSKIAQAVYGNSKYYLQIEQANPNVDATRLKPGMTINLPAIDTTAKPAAGAGTASVAQPQPAPAIDPKSEYKVQPNDSLYTISLRLYGKADRIEKIYELNKATIGDDMTRLKVGTVLKLPEAPTQGSTGTQQGTVATSG